MKLLFVHDHKFRVNDGKYYSTGALDHMALERYVRVFDEVKILARTVNDENCGRYSEIRHKSVIIQDIRNYTFKEILREIENSDRLIVRLPSFYGMIALHLNRKVKTPYLVEMVGCPWDEFWNYSWKTKPLAPLIALIDRYYVLKAPYVVYVTNRFLQKRYPTRGKNIACSNVTLTQVKETTLVKRLRKIEQEKSKLIIGTTAAIDVRYKGQQYVIKALKYLREQGDNSFEYQIVGNGSPDYLDGLIKEYGMEDRVDIIGGLPHEKVFDWLDTIDIYVQPSKQEGLPRALIEAMSRALPAIGSNTAGIPELLDGNYVYKHGKDEHISIAKLLVKISNEMEQQSVRNFNEAKNYNNELLEERRNKFLTQFMLQE